jgi:hypothetical protein
MGLRELWRLAAVVAHFLLDALLAVASGQPAARAARGLRSNEGRSQKSKSATRAARASRATSSSYRITVSNPQGVQDLNAVDAIYHWTELIQSSPLAVEHSVHA